MWDCLHVMRRTFECPGDRSVLRRSPQGARSLPCTMLIDGASQPRSVVRSGHAVSAMTLVIREDGMHRNGCLDAAQRDAVTAQL